MNDCIVWVPATPEAAVALAAETDARIAHKFTPVGGPLYAGRCAACDKELEDGARGANRGYASGLELGLCGGCTAHVNTPEAIEAGERLVADLRSRGSTKLGEFANEAAQRRRAQARR